MQGRSRTACGRKSLEFLCFNDMQFALIAIFNSQCWFLHLGWLVHILWGLIVFCAVTFAASMIAGMHFMCAIIFYYTVKSCAYMHLWGWCGWNLHCDAEHLVMAGFKLVGMFFKFNTTLIICINWYLPSNLVCMEGYTLHMQACTCFILSGTKYYSITSVSYTHLTLPTNREV